MIGKLTGTLDYLDGNKALIDVNGVGYVVQCSTRTLAKLGENGATVSLLIETQVREDAITLIGFADVAEKSAFLLLTTVQGVGAKVALAILSTLSAEQLGQAILTGDKALLSTADGVGPKLAARLLTELKDKAQMLGMGPVAAFAHSGGKATPAGAAGMAGDAVSTLVNLGFRRDQAYGAVMAALEAHRECGFDELIRLALQDLSPRR